MPRDAGTVDIFTIPWGGIEVNGKERKNSEKGKMSKIEIEINNWNEYVRK